ncbi:hypothetical protein [Rudaeicoccus suwonensis]|nr:hypothetical protein [Rudaeicoccus suwonensis]
MKVLPVELLFVDDDPVDVDELDEVERPVVDGVGDALVAGVFTVR